MLKFRVHRSKNFTNTRKAYDDIVAWLDDNVNMHFVEYPKTYVEVDPGCDWISLIHNHSVIFGSPDPSEKPVHIEYVLGKKWRASFVTLQNLKSGEINYQVAYIVDGDELIEMQLRLMFI